MIALDTIQSMMIMVLGFVSIVILLSILVLVHRQTRRVKELEMRMEAIDSIDAEQMIENQTERKEN